MDADSSISGGEPDDIRPISITEEMKTSYLDYAMSVIVSRALPDVRDGLKPVHRRILYSAFESGYVAGRPYRKSARIVGDVMGKYHPHGDSAIYDALARMTQDWSMRLPLIDGQGNFGSMDPDAPAAMRYTEARLAKVTEEMTGDLDKDTVDFVENYDGSESEPSVLPARWPNLLVNGAGGIAVGMATNIPPHNLGEVVRAALAYIENPAITAEELMEYVPAPDFPTGATVMGQGGMQSAYTTGRGSVIVRSRSMVEEGRNGAQRLVLTEIPYQTGKAGLVEKIAEAVKDKRVEGVSEMRDESSRAGVRIVLDLKRDATADVVLNQLYRHTQVQSSFAFNMLAIRGGRPELLNLRDIIEAFVKFREEVITRRSKYLLGKARERAHILLGLVVAVSNMDEVVRIIRGSASPAAAREELLSRDWDRTEIAEYIALVEGEGVRGAAVTDDPYRLSEAQVKAILDLRLNRLTQLGREEIAGELKEISYTIEDLLDILGDRARLYRVMRAELESVLEAYATPRRTEIVPYLDDIDDEDLIERDEMVVTVTMTGYIKRVPLSVYRAQRRGGKGRSGLNMKDEDVVTQLFVTSTHTPVLFFSSTGKVYRLKVWKLPEGTPQARGRAMANLLPLEEGETISTVLPLPEDEAEWARSVGGVRDAERARRGAIRHGRVYERPHARQVRHAVRGRVGRLPGRSRALHRRGRRVPRQPQGKGDPLFGDRHSRIHQPHVHRRARHEAEEGRRGHVAVGDRRRRRAGRGDPDGERERVRQADAGLGISPYGARRSGCREYRHDRQDRSRGRQFSDRGGRTADARHRSGQANPHPDDECAPDGAAGAGCDAARRRQGRKGRLSRQDSGRG